jgi:hypothetical protein
LEAQVDGKDPIIRELSFTTPQDYPKNIKNIELDMLTNKAHWLDNLFTLNITKPDELGYWKNNSGYDISLVINNKTEKTVSVANANQDISWKKFSIKEAFKYEQKLNDIIQISVKVWVKNAKGQKLYAGAAVCSKPLCLLNKSVSLYINKFAKLYISK